MSASDLRRGPPAEPGRRRPTRGCAGSRTRWSAGCAGAGTAAAAPGAGGPARWSSRISATTRSWMMPVQPPVAFGRPPLQLGGRARRGPGRAGSARAGRAPRTAGGPASPTPPVRRRRRCPRAGPRSSTTPPCRSPGPIAWASPGAWLTTPSSSAETRSGASASSPGPGPSAAASASRARASGMSAGERHQVGVPVGRRRRQRTGTRRSRPRRGSPAGAPRRAHASPGRRRQAGSGASRPASTASRVGGQVGQQLPAHPGVDRRSAARSGRPAARDRAAPRAVRAAGQRPGRGRRGRRPGTGRPPGRRAARPAGPRPGRAPGTRRSSVDLPMPPTPWTRKTRRGDRPPQRVVEAVSSRGRPTNVRLRASSSTSPSRIAPPRPIPVEGHAVPDCTASRPRTELPRAGQAGGSEATVVAMPVRCTSRISSERR